MFVYWPINQGIKLLTAGLSPEMLGLLKGYKKAYKLTKAFPFNSGSMMFQTAKTTVTIRQAMTNRHRDERALVRFEHRPWHRDAQDACRRVDLLLKLDDIAYPHM
jgi:hypothetical protein